MKNTMKKLLCMALAIMLLVSAVPVFAMAADAYSAEVSIKVNDAEVTNGSAHFKNTTAKVGDLLARKAEKFTGVDWSKVPEGAVLLTPEDTPVTDGESFTISYSYAEPVEHYVFVNVELDGVQQGPVKKTIDGNSITVGELLDTKIRQDLSGYDFLGDRDVTVADKETIVLPFKSKVVEVKDINIVVKVDGSDNVVWKGSKKPSDGVSSKVSNLLSYCWNSSWDDVYTFDHAWSNDQQKNVSESGSINAGDTVYIMLKTKGNNTEPTTPTTSGDLSLVITANGAEVVKKTIQNFTKSTVSNLIKNYLDTDWTSKYGFNEVAVGGVTYYRSDVEVKAADKTVNISLSRKYSKDNSNKVYLHVYLNGDASTIALTKDITGTYLMDDWKTDTNEILKYLKNNYYTAKDSSNAITIDGLYVSTDTKGAFPSNYYADNKVSSKDKINDLLEDGYVHISVMLKNAKAKSSSTADSSNPKTGDTIYVPMIVMGLTGTAAAAAYVFGKKRFAR